MTEIIQLQQYEQEIEQMKELIDIFNKNVKNEQFHQKKDETDEKSI